jgi:hypothetical protein
MKKLNFTGQIKQPKSRAVNKTAVVTANCTYTVSRVVPLVASRSCCMFHLNDISGGYHGQRIFIEQYGWDLKLGHLSRRFVYPSWTLLSVVDATWSYLCSVLSAVFYAAPPLYIHPSLIRSCLARTRISGQYNMSLVW